MPIEAPCCDAVLARGADDALEAWLARLGERMELDRERRREVLDEMRAHVLDAADAHEHRGMNRAAALHQAWADLGPEERVAAAVNAAHAGNDLADAVWVAALPVLLALLLRAGVLTLDGRAADWPSLALGVPFRLYAATALALPVISLPRRRFAAAAWAAFWLLSVLLLCAA